MTEKEASCKMGTCSAETGGKGECEEERRRTEKEKQSEPWPNISWQPIIQGKSGEERAGGGKGCDKPVVKRI